MLVTCSTCFRRERRDGPSTIVEAEGGRRRPGEHPQLASWHALRSARASGRVAVGACVCGQPLFAEAAAHPGVDWSLQTPAGALVVAPGRAGATGPMGALDDDGVEALLNDAWRERLRPVQLAFQSVLFTAMFVPVALWMVMVFVVVGFLIGFGRKPGFG